MRHRHQFAAEVAARLVDGVPLPAGTVVEMLGWHMRVGDGLADANGKAEQAERTPCKDHSGFDAYPYVLVMRQGERSLYDACSKERIVRVADIVHIVRSVAGCLQRLHAAGVVHADLKQRNIIRMALAWVLCDMDASARAGARVGAKSSSGYCSPEIACARFATRFGGGEVDAAYALDIWSLGVVLFELSAAQVPPARPPPPPPPPPRPDATPASSQPARSRAHPHRSARNRRRASSAGGPDTLPPLPHPFPWCRTSSRRTCRTTS